MRICIVPLLLVLVVAGCVTMSGRVNGPTYYSSEGNFSVPFPVSIEMGGKVLSDGPRTVTFHDKLGSRITFTALPFKEESPMTKVLQHGGTEPALTDFVQRDYGNSATVHFHPDVLGGAVTLMFQHATGQKTGVAAFVHDHAVYLVETDLLPGVPLLARNDAQSVHDRDLWLENRALTLAQTMQIR